MRFFPAYRQAGLQEAQNEYGIIPQNTLSVNCYRIRKLENALDIPFIL